MKLLSYILMLAGLALIAVKLWAADLLTKIPFLSTLNQTYTIAIGAILIILGIFLLLKKKDGKQPKAGEVPIYQGKQVVGYRRQ